MWSERAFPRILRAVNLRAPAASTLRLADLSRFGSVRVHSDDKRHHAFWSVAAATHRLVVDEQGGVIDIHALTLPLDRAFETRLDAARQLWRALNGRPPGVVYGTLPQQTKLRHILNLRAHDGRRAGMARRRIAEVLIPSEPISSRDWRDHPLRHKLRAILRRADRLVAGGYRDLLFYPHSRERHPCERK